MRVFYTDTGLSQDLGHHANACRLMAAEWRSRGCEVTVAASGNITAPLRAELGAHPHFRVHTYWQGDGDPFCGWLLAFFQAAGRTQEDLAALGPFSPEDLLYVNSIQPGQLMALAGFVQNMPAASRPRIVAELGTAPGLDFTWRDGMLQFNAKDPRYDAKGVLYRFAATHLAATQGADDPVLTTFHPTCSAIYSQLLLRHVHTLPLPHQAVRAAGPRPSGERVTIGVLGHQRADKGYHLVPEIAAALRTTCTWCRMSCANWPRANHASPWMSGLRTASFGIRCWTAAISCSAPITRPPIPVRIRRSWAKRFRAAFR
jgi:hypothetical protein